MEVREARAEYLATPVFKQTEAGTIPSDWKLIPFAEAVGSYIDYRGRTPRKLGMDWGDGEILALSANNVQAGRIAPEKEAYFGSKALYEKWMVQGDCEIGDVLLTMEAPLGNVAQIPDDRKYILSQRVVLIKPKLWLLRDYLAHFMMGSYFQNLLDSNATGTTAKGIQRAKLDELPIYVPPDTAEQQAIADTLGDADALIESLEHLLAKKRQIKQGTMQALLTGQQRLPGFEGAWEPILVGELLSFKNGLNKAKAFFGHGTPIVNYMDVFSSPSVDTRLLTGRVTVSCDELKCFDVRRGDVLFTRTSETPDEVGLSSVVMNEPVNTVFSGFVLRGRPKNNRLADSFKAYCFRSHPVRKQIISSATYTTRALVNGRLLSNVSLLVPSTEEQTAIATVLTDMDAEIAALEARLAKARALKQGMMQTLLTGRIRLV